MSPQWHPSSNTSTDFSHIAQTVCMVSSVTHVRPAPLACTECREKHLKCDGSSPQCSRCIAEGLRCTYKPSRRGFGRRRGNSKSADRSRQQRTPDAFAALTPVSGSSGINSYGRPAFSPSNTIEQSASGPNTLSDQTASLQAAHSIYPLTPPLSDRQSTNNELLIEAYYLHFHPAHPLLVPRGFFARQRYPDYLQWTVCWVGQHYATQNSGDSDIEGAVKTLLTADRDEITVSRAQALVLYTIILHSLHRPQEALECVKRAHQITNALGLHHPGFASSNATPGSVEEESIRRTWWELHVIETYLAALHRRPSLLTKTEGPYPFLPSPSESYNRGTCEPNPPSLTQFENRAFALEPRNNYSTCCYRIEAIHIVRRVLSLATYDHAQPDEVHALDNAIAGWKYYLPEERGDGGSNLEVLDPVLFQAHFFVHTASILLHFPRSNLPSTVPAAADIACVTGHTQGIPVLSQHAMKAIAASKKISNLAANLSSTESVSPLFSCALILACIVQLAASTLYRGSRDTIYSHPYRDRIVLLLGVLSEMGQKWTVARNALQPLRLIAESIFEASQVQENFAFGPRPAGDGLINGNEIAGVPWFDLFSAEELLTDFMASTS